MWQLLGHLWPNWSAILDGTGETLTIWFIIFPATLSIITLLYVFLRSHRYYRQNLSAISTLIRDQTPANTARNRLTLLQQVQTGKNHIVRDLWTEFDKTLVASPDLEKLYSTLDADYFFNSRSLAPELTENKLVNSVPSILIALGVLGTFIGLTIGLGGLGGTTGDIDTLKTGVNNLISGAVIAFSSSVWGVLFSIFMGSLLKWIEGRAHKQIHQLQARIDSLYRRQPPEESLLLIADATQQSRASLQGLAERIGERLQESVNSLSEGLQAALEATLTQVMGPAINKLVDSSSQQSSQVLEKLVNDFMSGMSAAGNAQAARMNDAAASVNTAINGLAENMQQMFGHLEKQQSARLQADQQNAERYHRQLQELAEASAQRESALAQVFSGLSKNFSTQLSQQLGSLDALDRERSQRNAQQAEVLQTRQQALLDGIASAVQSHQAQSLQMADQHRHLLTDLRKASDASAQSSAHLDHLASQLGELSRNLQVTVELFGQQLVETTRTVQTTITENNRIGTHIDRQVALMQQLQQTLMNSASQFEQGAHLAQTSFSTLEAHQSRFLSETRQQFDFLGGQLQDQVRGIENQARQWLEAYSQAVSQQIRERMQEWNDQTTRFSSDMVRALQQMSVLLDEMDGKR